MLETNPNKTDNILAVVIKDGPNTLLKRLIIIGHAENT